MKRVGLYIILMMFAFVNTFAGNILEYELVNTQVVAKEGFCIVKVWVYSSDKKVSADEFKKAAVHGILFKGVSASATNSGLNPLAGSSLAEKQHSDFFNSFFGADKQYNSYVTLAATPYEYIKLNKKYKVGTVAIISKEALRKDMEKAGIIRGLSSGF